MNPVGAEWAYGATAHTQASQVTPNWPENIVDPTRNVGMVSPQPFRIGSS